MSKFTFIDLFAGIGGIRIAMEAAGGSCVMTSEIDRFAEETYKSFFADDDNHVFVKDITAIEPFDVPDHDVLVGGFPCQPFSLAGVSKKNSLGRKHGFEDPAKGTLFFNVKAILEAKRPSAFVLENVKNLRGHDRGNTWKVIERSLREAGYIFSERIIDAKKVVPQHRERVFIIGFDRGAFGLNEFEERDWSGFWEGVDFRIGQQHHWQRKLYGLTNESEWPNVGAILQKKVDPKYTLTDNLWRYLQSYKAKHKAAGNGFGFGTVNAKSAYTRTISARYYKDGAEILVEQEGGVPRRLTPLECARIQGFPADFQSIWGTTKQPVSDSQAYKQFGNSVSVPVVTAIALELHHAMANNLNQLAPAIQTNIA